MYAIPTEEEYIQIKKLINILASHGFGQWANGEEYWQWSREYGRRLSENYGFTFFDGCSKVVAVSCDCPWVIKVDLNPNEGPSWNHNTYCEQEAENWIVALNSGMEQFFAATYFMEIINNVEYFIQEYVDCDEEEISSRCYDYCHSDHSEDEEYDDYDEYWDMSDEDRLFALFGCGIETHDLIDFCQSLYINDLHVGNFGEKANGQAVIIDYSGY